MPFLALAGIFFALWLATAPAEPELAPEALPAKPRGSFHEGERVIVIGLPMSGKTTLAAKLTDDCPRLLYFTTTADDAGKFRTHPIPADEFIDDPSAIKAARFRIAVIAEAGEEAEQLSAVLAIARAAGDCVLVLDEVGDYKQRAELDLIKLARNGRHNGLVTLYVSQMAIDIPKGVRRLATRVYSFRQYHPHDIKALAEVYGEDYAERVQSARGHEVVKWNLADFAPSASRGDVQ